MIQDIFPHRYHNEYQDNKPDKDSYLLFYEENSVLMKKEGNFIDFPQLKEVDGGETLREACTYLFSIDGAGYFLPTEKPVISQGNEGYSMEKISIFRQGEPMYKSFAGITGYQLYQWYQDNRFCGRCAAPMKRAAKERMLYCSCCGKQVYPKISPAVIVGVLDGERILMTKYSGRAYKRYALIAGFNEIGETIEETVHREVMEEVGLKVKNVRYYKSQPWSFSDTLLMGFYCDLDGSDIIHLDRRELSVGEWLYREQIPEIDPRLSLTNEMILRFKNGEEREAAPFQSAERDEKEIENFRGGRPQEGSAGYRKDDSR